MSITHANFLTQVRNYTEVDSNVLTDSIIQDFIRSVELDVAGKVDYCLPNMMRPICRERSKKALKSKAYGKAVIRRDFLNNGAQNLGCGETYRRLILCHQTILSQ